MLNLRRKGAIVLIERDRSTYHVTHHFCSGRRVEWSAEVQKVHCRKEFNGKYLFKIPDHPKKFSTCDGRHGDEILLPIFGGDGID